MLGAFALAVAASHAILGGGAGLFFVVDVGKIGLLGQLMQAVDVVVGIGLEDPGDVDALGAGLALAAAGAVQLGEAL